jgi:hypothetical protein
MLMVQHGFLSPFGVETPMHQVFICLNLFNGPGGCMSRRQFALAWQP